MKVYNISRNPLTKKRAKIPISNLISSQYIDSFILLKDNPVYFAGKVNLFTSFGNLGAFIFFFKVLIQLCCDKCVILKSSKAMCAT